MPIVKKEANLSQKVDFLPNPWYNTIRMGEDLPPSSTLPQLSVELPYESRDLELVAGRPTARQMKRAVARVQLLRLAMRGMNAKQAAQAVGLPESTVLLHYRDPEFQEEVMKRVSGALGSSDANFKGKVKTLHERIEEQAEASFQDLVEMLENEKLPLHLRARINQDFLDRCQASQKENTLNVKGLTIDPNQLIVAAQVAMEIDQRRQSPCERSEPSLPPDDFPSPVHPPSSTISSLKAEVVPIEAGRGKR